MNTERWHGIPSERRNMPVDESLCHFGEMNWGFLKGQNWCIRTRISVGDPSKVMCDPVLYHCSLEPHQPNKSNLEDLSYVQFLCTSS